MNPLTGSFLVRKSKRSSDGVAISACSEAVERSDTPRSQSLHFFHDMHRVAMPARAFTRALLSPPCALAEPPSLHPAHALPRFIARFNTSTASPKPDPPIPLPKKYTSFSAAAKSDPTSVYSVFSVVQFRFSPRFSDHLNARL